MATHVKKGRPFFSMEISTGHLRIELGPGPHLLKVGEIAEPGTRFRKPKGRRNGSHHAPHGIETPAKMSQLCQVGMTKKEELGQPCQLYKKRKKEGISTRSTMSSSKQYVGVVLKVLVRSLVFGDHRCWLR